MVHGLNQRYKEDLQQEHKYEEPMQDEATYICDSCGEEIVVPIDLTEGEFQQYVEDCPVCCNPNRISVEVSEDGEVRAWTDHK